MDWLRGNANRQLITSIILISSGGKSEWRTNQWPHWLYCKQEYSGLVSDHTVYCQEKNTSDNTAMAGAKPKKKIWAACYQLYTAIPSHCNKTLLVYWLMWAAKNNPLGSYSCLLQTISVIRSSKCPLSLEAFLWAVDVNKWKKQLFVIPWGKVRLPWSV